MRNFKTEIIFQFQNSANSIETQQLAKMLKSLQSKTLFLNYPIKMDISTSGRDWLCCCPYVRGVHFFCLFKTYANFLKKRGQFRVK